MKKIAFVLSSLALLFGLTQCKKNLETVNSVANGKVEITYSTGGSRTNITEAGVVTWTAGDIIHVYASTTGYLGSLTLSSGAGTGEGTFTGSLSSWTDDETLRFYYLGTNTKKSDNTFVIDYSAQDGTLATIASKYHVSCYTEENVSASKTSFNGQMLNQIAIAKFDVNDFGSGNVKIYAEDGFRNMIKISDKGVLSYGVAGVHPTIDHQSGHIVIGAAGAEKYVALLPSDGEITMQFTSQSKTGSDAARTIAANDFIGYSSAVAITASDVVSSYVDFAVASDHVFSVAPGTTVKFAKGNLVYDQGRFKMHSTQYGKCFTSDGDISSYLKVSGTFDYFGWGTSGWNNGNLLYMPYTFSEASNGDYSTEHGNGYGPTNGKNYKMNLNSYQYTNSDWGVYQFGMNAESGWRTLESYEWEWLLGTYDYSTPGESCRNESIRFLNAIITVGGNTYRGLIIFPDGFSGVSYTGNNYSWNNYSWGAQTPLETVSETDWAAMEAAGAVFLPAVGSRSLGSEVSHIGTDAHYWSSSTNYNGKSEYAYNLIFNRLSVMTELNYKRCYGIPVRLVR